MGITPQVSNTTVVNGTVAEMEVPYDTYIRTGKYISVLCDSVQHLESTVSRVLDTRQIDFGLLRRLQKWTHKLREAVYCRIRCQIGPDNELLNACYDIKESKLSLSIISEDTYKQNTMAISYDSFVTEQCCEYLRICGSDDDLVWLCRLWISLYVVSQSLNDARITPSDDYFYSVVCLQYNSAIYYTNPIFRKLYHELLIRNCITIYECMLEPDSLFYKLSSEIVEMIIDHVKNNFVRSLPQ
jgi:hypothetical protein